MPCRLRRRLVPGERQARFEPEIPAEHAKQVRLGEVGLLFHAGGLFSFYGLAIRRDSPFRDTLAIGYTDGCVGYLCDPSAYRTGAYEAFTVPKILDNPPFTPTAARQLTAAALNMLKALAT